MSDYLVLGVVALGVGAICLTLGYAIGQGMCRRQVRAELWRMFEALEPAGEAETPYTRGAMRWDVLALLKRLEW